MPLRRPYESSHGRCQPPRAAGTRMRCEMWPVAGIPGGDTGRMKSRMEKGKKPWS
jgi:hypothetical protein